MQLTEDIYLGRQPILDSEQQIQAFELLFRSGNANHAGVADGVKATSSVIVQALSEFGIESVLGKHAGFINCDAAFLLSDEIELLPPDKVVLEILETTKASEDVLQRCCDLKTKGFRIALDDFQGVHDDNRGFLPLVDVIKVDVLGMDERRLTEVTREATGSDAILLAEKVETQDIFRQCVSLGYRLFQGYYFSTPEIVPGRKLSSSQLIVVQLLDLIRRDAEVFEIENVFKQNPFLGVNLMRLANSAAVGLRAPLRSIANAIVVLGRRQLQRWLLLLLLTEHHHEGSRRSFWLHLAATRGQFMELVAKAEKHQMVVVDSAFIVGVVSVMELMLGVPMESLLGSLGLSEEVKLALLQREGPLGNLLSLAQALEGGDDGFVAHYIAAMPNRNVDILNQAQGQALAWANNIQLEM